MPKPIRAYVGTYSTTEAQQESPGKGKGIYVFEMDPATGFLTGQDVFVNGNNPTWIHAHPDGIHLYGSNEVAHFEGQRSGSVSAYTIERSTGRLSLLNTVSSEGAWPAHLSVHPSGRYVLVANYAGGTIAVLPIRPGGALGPATDVKHDVGPAGKERATSGPPGSLAISGHDGPHPHMIGFDPTERHILNTDLGLDRIYVWTLDLESGKLHSNNPPFVALPSGDGPRHFVFHPTGPWMYSLQEEASTVVLFDYDAEGGKLSPRQAISSLPGGFAGTNFTSEMRISRDGRFLYAANRLHDSISWFSIGKDGTLSFAGGESTRGDYPRSFSFDPSETFLYSCNQHADAVTLFRRDAQSGQLTFTGRYFPVASPAVILFTR